MNSPDRKKILLIDDDTNLLATLGTFLGSEGYDVVTADSGEAGLEKLADMAPDLIILDMSMPGMGGIGFLKDIFSDDGVPKHPVLVLTARSNMAEFFSEVAVDGFIAKPCDPSDLLMEVGRIIFLRSGTPAGASEKAKPAPGKVLIAEDDTHTNENLVGAFAGAGFVAHGVFAGPEVLEKAIIEKPDIIVLKYVLAGMNGDAVAGMLKEMPNTKHIPVVLYDDSGSDLADDEVQGEGSVVKRIVRNNNSADLVGAVREILEA
jgi:CheY-like chemotaxis protein